MPGSGGSATIESEGSGSGSGSVDSTGVLDTGDSSADSTGEPPAEDRYWVGRDGDWSDPMHWSQTPAGPPGASVPDAVSRVTISGPVAVTLDAGDVEIRGADEGLAVRTGLGIIDVVTPGHADLRTGAGDVEVMQSGLARDLHVETGDGAITVTLASDADLDLQIRTRGRIWVRTPSLAVVVSGALDRRTGNGTTRVVLESPRGDVEVRSVDSTAGS